MSPTVATAAVVLTVMHLFAAGMTLHATLSDGLTASAGIAAERVAMSAPLNR